MASILLPAVFGAIFYKHLTAPIRPLALFMFCGVFSEAIGYICYTLKVNNMPLFHAHTLLELVFFSFIFFKILQNTRTKVIPIIVLIGFIIYWLIDLLFITSIFAPNSISKTIESVILIAYCFIFLSERQRFRGSRSQEKDSFLILNSGLLIFFSGTIVVSYYSDDLMKNELFTIWTIRSILNIFLNIVYTVVIWKSVESISPHEQKIMKCS